MVKGRLSTIHGPSCPSSESNTLRPEAVVTFAAPIFAASTIVNILNIKLSKTFSDPFLTDYINTHNTVAITKMIVMKAGTTITMLSLL